MENNETGKQNRLQQPEGATHALSQTAPKKDAWDKVQVIATVSATIMIPVVLAIVGHNYTRAIKESENQVKYIEIAVSILKLPPSEQNAALREWATDVLGKHSPVPLAEAAKISLRRHGITVPDPVPLPPCCDAPPAIIPEPPAKPNRRIR